MNIRNKSADFLKKISKQSMLKGVIIFAISIVLALLVERTFYSSTNISGTRVVLFLLCILFLLINFAYDRKKIWGFIYVKRYLLGIVIFASLVVFGFHGSSINELNNVIQPDIKVSNTDTLIGQSRVIRSDEYSVGTLLGLSQNAKINNYSSVNKSVMAQNKYVTFYFHMPSWDISTLSKPNQLGYLFLPVNQGFSFNWYLPIFMLFFATFEFLMILTKKNKLCSLVGAVMITFAPATQWWSAYLTVASGEFAMVGIYHYFKTDKLKYKILLGLFIGWCGSIYVMEMYPAWLVPYGYFFLGIVIYFLISFHKQIHKWDIPLLIVIVISTMILIILPGYLKNRDIYTLMVNTVYPGSRFERGGYGFSYNFSYLANLFFPFKEGVNFSEGSSFISFYPIPMITSAILIIKSWKNKKDSLLIIILITACFLNLWNFIKFPYILAKITMLSMSTVTRCTVTLSYINVILLVLCLNYFFDRDRQLKTNNNRLAATFVIAFFMACVGVNILRDSDFFKGYMTIGLSIMSIVIFTSISMLIMNTNKGNKKIVTVVLVVLSLLSGATVHPISRGLNVVFNKPISIKVQSILKHDSSSTWLGVNTSIALNNYVAAQGARIIDCTNYYPNINLWKKIDKKQKYNHVYNRYAHVGVNFINKGFKFRLVSPDAFVLDMSINYLKVMKVKYIVSQSDISSFSNKYVKISNIYSEDGIYIFKVS